MNSYVGYSTDLNIRYQATSGGVGTSLIKWMFETGIIGTSISFEFNKTTLQYTPKMIHSFNEYQLSASIYQEIDLINFIKSHLTEIRGAFACFTLPCQTRAVRAIVEKIGHDVIIIGLTCSSQQTLEATKYLLKRVGIPTAEVVKIQYRGNGWPSGIQIETVSGNKCFVANEESIWSKIFHSRMFIRPKCFICQDTLNRFSDLTLADPWLKKFRSEQVGRTLIVCNSFRGEYILQQCMKDKKIVLEPISYDEAIESQKGTILRKRSYIVAPNIVKLYRKVLNSKIYRKIMLKSSLFYIHCNINSLIERYLIRLMRNKQ